jgi:tetratricopeptide (TPR) repeat protein
MAIQDVQVRQELIDIPTYEPMPPDKHPMFLEKRVYQGSSGKVYPLPVYNSIASTPTPHKWKAIHIENEFIQVMILPEIGGRIHIGLDKTNGYDFFYRQNVIKPALVGLTGPWASGGVEFNWPQHHRPATYMSVDTQIEDHEDGSKTVWFSDHDPLNRMKGMHGVCLHPGKSYIELKVRAYNRTSLVQTFLWWANVATRVHEGYQSFFPPDVYCVADHAKRATSLYPLCEDSYYGVDYGSRAKKGVPEGDRPKDFIPPYLSKVKSDIPEYKANDLTWYANIPVPTSYMCVGSQEDFFGGYDHSKKAGVVHVANHHISPGKKQWTWGNQEFGYAWDRNLTDADGPYIEIMAGVYTDNQPDFSYLQPGETKTWSQYWYPVRDIGPAQKANTRASLSLKIENDVAKIGVAATERLEKAQIQILKAGKVLKEWTQDLAPDQSFVETISLEGKSTPDQIQLRLLHKDVEIISYRPAKPTKRELPEPAQEPVAPTEMKSVDELYITGLHLDQYRHATRKPEAYWLEALRRDPGDSRCNNGMGLRQLRRGEFQKARASFDAAVARLTKLNPNPYDGEAYYNLGQALRFLNLDDEAYGAYYKATWNQAWQSASYHAIAEIDCKRGDWDLALDHLDRSLRLNTDNLRARDLEALAYRKLGREKEAQTCLRETLEIDPLDWWARHLSGQEITCNTQTRLDFVLDFARAGLYQEALELLKKTKADPQSGTEPLIHYYTGWILNLLGKEAESLVAFQEAADASSDYCFPSRLEEIEILELAIAKNSADSKAPYYLGNLLYDKERFEEGVKKWELSVKRDPKFSIVWRNLGIGYFNILHKEKKALDAFEKAFVLDPKAPRILYERDQLWKRLGTSPVKRLKELEKYKNLVSQWDGLTVELCALYNQTGQSEKSLPLVSTRDFQPWEGGEGATLGQHVRTHLSLGRALMREKNFAQAKAHFEMALTSPRNLGEANHLLANQSDIHYWIGNAEEALGNKAAAKAHWTIAAGHKGDFQQMSVVNFSELTYFTAISLDRLGKKKEATKLLKDMLAHAQKLEKVKAKIDYFATSLPDMLLFNDDLQFRQITSARFMQALAQAGLNRKPQALKLLKDVLKRDPSHAAAADFNNELSAPKTKPRKA